MSRRLLKGVIVARETLGRRRSLVMINARHANADGVRETRLGAGRPSGWSGVKAAVSFFDDRGQSMSPGDHPPWRGDAGVVEDMFHSPSQRAGGGLAGPITSRLAEEISMRIGDRDAMRYAESLRYFRWMMPHSFSIYSVGWEVITARRNPDTFVEAMESRIERWLVGVQVPPHALALVSAPEAHLKALGIST